MYRHLATMTALASLCFTSVQADENFNVKSKNREAIIATKNDRDYLYEGAYKFSPAVRAGDYIFFSGVVAGARDDKPLDRDAYKDQVRRAFAALGRTLKAAGAGFEDVAKIRTFHVFDSPLITIPKQDQVLAIAEVKGEFIPEPHPAWTAVGTTALLPDRGLVEIEIVAYSPEE